MADLEDLRRECEAGGDARDVTLHKAIVTLGLLKQLPVWLAQEFFDLVVHRYDASGEIREEVNRMRLAESVEAARAGHTVEAALDIVATENKLTANQVRNACLNRKHYQQDYYRNVLKPRREAERKAQKDGVDTSVNQH